MPFFIDANTRQEVWVPMMAALRIQPAMRGPEPVDNVTQIVQGFDVIIGSSIASASPVPMSIAHFIEVVGTVREVVAAFAGELS